MISLVVVIVMIVLEVVVVVLTGVRILTFCGLSSF